MGEYQKGIDDYNKAISIKPNAITYFNRGNSYKVLGQYQKAIDDYTEAIRLKPDFANAYGNRSSTNFSQGNITECCVDARIACRLGNCIWLKAARQNNMCNMESVP
jgi:tetratricopeptide (TPR) repeat protein